MHARRQQGVTLIELMIGLVVLAILVAMAVPSFSAWIANTQIRNGAEAVLNGLQFARAEAIKLNTNIEFAIPSGTAWTVTNPADGSTLQSRAEEGTSKVSATNTPDASTKVTFNGMGWVTANADGSARITQVDVTSNLVQDGSQRPLRVIITPGGSTKMCDPAVNATDPRACP